MSDKAYPGGGEPSDKEEATRPSPPPPEETKPMLPSPFYVIQIPKDQIYRIPPPENAHKYKLYSRRAERRRGRGCCCLLLWFVSAVFFLAVSTGISAGVLYLVFRPKLPSYSIDSLAVSGLNLSSPANTFSPKVDIVVRTENPNKKIGIYYKEKSSIRVSYSGMELCDGEWPAFYHGKRNTTVVQAALVGSAIELSKDMRKDLTADEKRGAVPLRILIHIPVRVKFGAATTWTFTVKTRCNVTVDTLGKNAKVKNGSNTCKVYQVKLFS